MEGYDNVRMVCGEVVLATIGIIYAITGRSGQNL